MLTDEMKKEMDAEIAIMAHRRAAVSEALKIVQRHRGWISDESVQEIAEYLDMTPDEVDAVATFYSVIRRRPVGRHVILICDSVTCWILGYETLLAHLLGRLGIGQVLVADVAMAPLDGLQCFRRGRALVRTARHVLACLYNKAYAGRIIFRPKRTPGEPNQWTRTAKGGEGIVSLKQFERAQKILERPDGNRPRKPRR